MKNKLFEKAEKVEQEESSFKEKAPSLIAKRDFIICHNGYERLIKVGDDLSDVPAEYYENLKTENVL